MFISQRDALIKCLSAGIDYCVGVVSNADYDKVIKATESSSSYDDAINLLNEIPGLRAVNVSEEITEEFLGDSSWFTETVQADKSCAVLYNEDNNKSALITFYDKECDFFIIDYLDLTNVEENALLFEPVCSLTECIVYKSSILGKFSKVIILQGKESV